MGFILRQVMQRHVSIFARIMGSDLTPTQWAVLSHLLHHGSCSQNLLGRNTAMDAATIKGVVDRLGRRGLIETAPDPTDARRVTVQLSAEGEAFARDHLRKASEVTELTLTALDAAQRRDLMQLLKKLR